MDRLAFGRTGREHAVWMMNLDTGEASGIPTPLNDRYAFDDAVPRRGWVAVAVGYQVAAFRDGGDPRFPMLLPEAWQIHPACTDDALLLRRYFGRSTEPDERTMVEVVGSDGRVLRSMELPWEHDEWAHVVGEVDAGVVTTLGIAHWGGGRSALPEVADGLEPIGALAGRVVVFAGAERVEAVDLVDGSRRVGPTGGPPRPSGFRHWRVRQDTTGRWLIATDNGSSVVVGAASAPRPLPGVDLDHLWSGERLLLGMAEGEAVEYDPATGSRRPVALGIDREAGPWPVVDVSGRFAFRGAYEEPVRLGPVEDLDPTDLSCLAGIFDIVEVAGGASVDAIRAAEQALGPFPVGYRSFLAEFGAARLDGGEIFGLADGWPDVVVETLQERELPYKKLPPDLVAVYNDGFGNIHAVRSSDGSDDEGVYVHWHDDESAPERVASSFVGWLRTLPPQAD